MGTVIAGSLAGAVNGAEMPPVEEGTPVSQGTSKLRTIVKYTGNTLAAWGAATLTADTINLCCYEDYNNFWNVKGVRKAIAYLKKEKGFFPYAAHKLVAIPYVAMGGSPIDCLLVLLQPQSISKNFGSFMFKVSPPVIHALVMGAGEGIAYLAGGKEATWSYSLYEKGKRIYTSAKEFLSKKRADTPSESAAS